MNACNLLLTLFAAAGLLLVHESSAAAEVPPVAAESKTPVWNQMNQAIQMLIDLQPGEQPVCFEQKVPPLAVLKITDRQEVEFIFNHDTMSFGNEGDLEISIEKPDKKIVKIRNDNNVFVDLAVPDTKYIVCMSLSSSAAESRTVLFSLDISVTEKGASLGSSAQKITSSINAIHSISHFLERQQKSHLKTTEQVIKKIYTTSIVRIGANIIIAIVLNRMLKRLLEVRSFI